MKVLILEDQVTDSEILSRRVKVAMPDAQIELAGSLAQALPKVDAVDVVLCDLNLPDSDAAATIGAVAAANPRRWIALTDDVDLSEQARACGAHVLSKDAGTAAWADLARSLGGL